MMETYRIVLDLLSMTLVIIVPLAIYFLRVKQTKALKAEGRHEDELGKIETELKILDAKIIETQKVTTTHVGELNLYIQKLLALEKRVESSIETPTAPESMRARVEILGNMVEQTKSKMEGMEEVVRGIKLEVRELTYAHNQRYEACLAKFLWKESKQDMMKELEGMAGGLRAIRAKLGI